MNLLQHLELRRTGPAEATVGMISLPLPRELAGTARIDHPRTAMLPVGWWERRKTPRRAIAYVLDDGGVPETLRLGTASSSNIRLGSASPSSETPGGEAEPSRAWTAIMVPTIERQTFKPAAYRDIDSLRGVPAEDCATMQGLVELCYGGKTLILQAGATGPGDGPYYWENVQVDPVWANAVAQGMRLGGIIYNGDTYLWADIYLVLFANGVADVSAHFFTSRLHIKGYDFQGMPYLRLAGNCVKPVTAAIPTDGVHFALGDLKLNLTDAARLCSAEYPGRLEAVDGEARYYPLARTLNPQLPDAPPEEWQPGLGRTIRFQMSLSDAPPLIARYQAPGWLYALSGEPLPWEGALPVHGACEQLALNSLEGVRAEMVRGRFDTSFEERSSWDGDVCTALLHSYYHFGRTDYLTEALDYCYFWADIMVDHVDYSVRQWGGGWGWKTCAYTKFRDLLYGYLETGDPYLLDGAEMVAEDYWSWYRANWPRNSMGRDNFEIGGWARLWRFLDSPHARERVEEFVRMNAQVLAVRDHFGSQMGAGPHPGCRPSLYMVGVGMLSLVDVAEAATERDDQAMVEQVLAMLTKLHTHFTRDDMELFVSDFGDGQNHGRTTWGPEGHHLWGIMALRLYPEMLRLAPDNTAAEEGLRLALRNLDSAPGAWQNTGRLIMGFENPLYADMLLLGARLEGDGVTLAPLCFPPDWPAEQRVDTPWGDLTVTVRVENQRTLLTFSAERDFPVTVRYAGQEVQTNSRGQAEVERE